MIRLNDLKTVLSNQKDRIVNTLSFPRDLLDEIQFVPNFALIITGIRRCGKSTLLSQVIDTSKSDWLYLNFDTPQLFQFELGDFRMLDEILMLEPTIKWLYFDEIQIVNGWEVYVRGKLDEGYFVIITGSNASLLSRELGTKLTGRHQSKELFPFSFHEFCAYTSNPPSKESLQLFLERGGLPQYLTKPDPDLMYALLNDILFRDIAVRNNIRDEKSLKNLLIYLSSNIGTLVSANKLKEIIGVKSAATVLEYLSMMEQAYLIELVPRFHYSYKKQIAHPRKVYFIDNGLQSAMSVSFSQDWGRKFENMIYWEFRRHFQEIYYFQESGYECDFVLCRNNQPQRLIQACYELNSDNWNREIKGLLQTMDFFGLKTGTIYTLHQQDLFIQDDKTIQILPYQGFI